MIKINKNTSKKNLLLGVIIILVFVSGMIVGRGKTYRVSIPGESGIEGFDLNANPKVFWDTWKVIREKYKDANKVGDQDMIYGAAGGLVHALGDPYSEFFKPVNGKRFLDDINGSFEGIGAEIGIKDNVLTIIAPLEGTPAKKAGLKSGDKIIKIDKKITMDMSIEEAVQLIRGKRNTNVVLTIVRDNGQSKEISITRGIIKIPAVTWDMIPNSDIAHIRLFSFTKDLSHDFANVAQEILKSSAKKIILDVRDNPGGYLNVAVDITGWFLDNGKVVVIESRGDGKDQEYKTSGPSVFKDWPVAVIINKGSASASEILAGALRDDRGSTIIGETSFGKGSVQEMINLEDGSYLKLTVANWLTPKGMSISKAGIQPDITVKRSENAEKNKEDVFLKKTVDILNGQ